MYFVFIVFNSIGIGALDLTTSKGMTAFTLNIHTEQSEHHRLTDPSPADEEQEL